MKALGIDPGDVWVGIAISDGLKMTCRPLETAKLPDFEAALERILKENPIDTVVVGHPKTLKGEKSKQTLKVEAFKERLEKKYPTQGGHEITWILWDERLSSKRAESLGHAKTKAEKQKGHAKAASFILQSYLDHLAFTRMQEA